MQPKHAALVVLTCALLLAPAAYYATRTSPHPDAPMPTKEDAPPGLLVQRTAHPNEIQTTPTNHTSNLTIFADDPEHGILETWNTTTNAPHISNTTNWPHLIRIRAIPLEGPALLRWVWIGNYTLTSSPDLPTLLKQVGESHA